MKHQALFPWKDKSKKIKCRLLQFLFCALRLTGTLNYFEITPRIEVEVPEPKAKN